MTRIRAMLLVATIFALVAASCGSADTDDGSDAAEESAEDTSTDSSGDESSDDGASDEDPADEDPADEADEPTYEIISLAGDIVPGFVLVDKTLTDVDRVIGAIRNEVGPVETSLSVEEYLLILDEEGDGEDNLTGDELNEVSGEIQNEIENRVEVLKIPNTSFDEIVVKASINDAELWELLQAGAIAPINVMTASGHWSALPGTKPHRINSTNWDDAKSAGSIGPIVDDDRVIGVVDTGWLGGGEPWMDDTTVGKCGDISHGQAVASVIDQVNPSATVIPADAFLSQFDCLHTQEAAVFLATRRIFGWAFANGIEVDVLNYSIGTPGYYIVAEIEGVGAIEIFLEPILLRQTLLAVQAVFSDNIIITAAGGNHYDEHALAERAGSGDEHEAVRGNYPAIFASHPDLSNTVTAVFAAGPEALVQWDDNGDPYEFLTAPWTTAPGCALILDAVNNTSSSDDVVVWSGSSFASPIVAATDNTNVTYGSLPTGLWNDGIYSNAPTGCEPPSS